MLMLLTVSLSLVAHAEDIEIGQCDTENEVCQALQEQYGADSTVVYSITPSEACPYTTTITLANGETQVVYVSAKPGSNVVDPPPVNNPSSGELPDPGIVMKPGDLGINEIELPQTSMDDILNWATTKGNEVIYVLQIFCQPFAIIIFIIAAFMTLIGCIGKADMVGKGVWGMILSVVVYAAVLYAPVILQAFVGWVAS